jgi:hypothetical protein
MFIFRGKLVHISDVRFLLRHCYFPCIRQKRKCYHSNSHLGKRDLHFTSSQLHGVATTLSRRNNRPRANQHDSEQNHKAGRLLPFALFVACLLQCCYTSQATVHGHVYMFPSILRWKSGIITIITRMWLRAAAATGAC